MGVGCIAPGSSYNYLGSSSWVALTVEKPIIDDQRRTMNWAHVVPGLLHPSGTMQTAGASYNWMVNQLCKHERYQAKIQEQNVFDLIDDLIRESPIGSNKLLFLPYMLGERTPRWNVDAKGAFVGLTVGHKQSDMVRAVMEGITLNLGYIVDIFRAHVPINQMTVIGGGAKNKIWQQMMADIYQAEIKIPNYLEEATSMGAAVLAGIGCGIFQDFKVIDRFVEIRDTITPIPENVEKYKKLMPVFDQTYHALNGIYDDLAKLKL
ncbi:MAG: FGGY-family carbohydrate kinase [Bacteroidales bacterium]